MTVSRPEILWMEQELPARIEAARARIRDYVRKTPLEESDLLSELCGARVLCKLENLQHTGSFKVRGAFSKLLGLPLDQRERGVVAASTGNHGAAVAFAKRQLGAPGVIFVPEGTSQAKLSNISRLGGDVHIAGRESGEAERLARDFALARQLVYVSPYNDWDVVAGQGTIGVELWESYPKIDVVIASLGGGGLVGGLGAFLKSRNPGTRVVGVSPDRSAAMIESMRAGRVVRCSHGPTLSDATAGDIEDNALTLGLCRHVVDDCLTVSEEEIALGMRLFIEGQHMLCEGSAGAAIAGLLRCKESLAGKDVAVIICGANISTQTLKSAL